MMLAPGLFVALVRHHAPEGCTARFRARRASRDAEGVAATLLPCPSTALSVILLIRCARVCSVCAPAAARRSVSPTDRRGVKRCRRPKNNDTSTDDKKGLDFSANARQDSSIFLSHL